MEAAKAFYVSFLTLNIMHKIVAKRVLIIAFLIYFLFVTGYAESAEKHITIAILPCSDVVMTFKKFHPLITHIKQQTGFDVELVVPKDYSKIESFIKKGELDFVFIDPHTYLRSAKLFNKKALIRTLTREGGTSQYGLIIVRKGSGINKIDDLRGKTVMFGPKLSAVKWLAAKEMLKENGINIDKDLRAYVNGGCCEDIAFNVYLKAVDAGVVCDHFLDEHSEKQKELGIDSEQIIIIGKTKLVPTRIFAARKEVSAEIVNKVNQALLTLDKKNPEHAKILSHAELGGFQKSKDEEYDSLRMLVNPKH
jgi:phosphonate transport system substrate-binding protein